MVDPHTIVENPAPLTSIVVLCCNLLAYTRLCLESVFQYTDSPFELMVVDNASTDGTETYLEELARREADGQMVVIRNETNVGFPAGCNQGIARARGEFILLLNNDTIVSEGWLSGLIRCATGTVGLVGPVSNGISPPQYVAVDCRTPAMVPAVAAEIARQYRGEILEVKRLIGFCLLIRRDVLDRIGYLDERFGLGFFEDDDICFRAADAGFKVIVARDVFIHHFGSRTYRALGIDIGEQLNRSFESLQAKWGADRTSGYRRWV